MNKMSSSFTVQGSALKVVLMLTLGTVFVLTEAAEGINVGDELIIAADGAGGNLRGTPAVAFGKNTYLVTWREGQILKSSHAVICMKRVDTNGKALDAKSVEVAPCKDPMQERPATAYSNGVFLVVWQDFRNGNDFDILGVRITPEGKVLDAKPIMVATGARTQVLPALAADDNGFFVAWQGFQGQEDGCRTFVTRVETDGRVNPPVALDYRSDPKIAWNGKELLVVFGTPHDPGGGSNMNQCMRIGADCKPTSQPERITHRAQASVCGVPGKGWLVVNQRAKPDHWGWGGPGAMICQSIELDGKPSADIPKTHEGNWEKMPNWLDATSNDKKLWPYGGSAVTWDGKHCIAVWTRWHVGGATGIDLTNGDIIASRVDGWKPMDSDGVFVANSDADERSPALASDAAGGLICVYEKKLPDGKMLVAAKMLNDK